MTYRRLWASLGLALVLIATWCAYAPGLAGDFLFDDFVNLDKLASPGAVDNWPAFWRYITSGIADPLGRPLSLLTFLVDARNWPADPAPFLRTNVLLHLLNGALLFALLRRLGRALGEEAPARDFAALVGAGLWMLHPLFVSTTLYIVQREAMLPATFTLSGLIAYLHGREQLASAPRAGLAWMVAGIGLGTLLATLCKANGALLPLLAWVIESRLPRNDGSARPPRWFVAGAFVLPTIAVFAYLLAQLPKLHDFIAHRPWTIAERLLTEPRVLFEYLRLLAIPRVLSNGVYNDGFPASRGLLDPPTTLVAILALAALVTFAFLSRKRFPALSMALLFFFAGHLLESTTIALELYFEHRNYLPALLLGWPIGLALARWKVSARVRAAAGIVLLAFLALSTWQRADLWGSPQRMTTLWAAQNSASSRAQATAAAYEIQAGRADLARARLEPLRRAQPHDLQLVLNYASASCDSGGLSRADIDAVAEAFAHASEGDQMVYRWITRTTELARTGRCPGLDLDAIQQWISATWRNPRVAALPGRRQDLHSLAGQLALARGDADGAQREFDRALDEAWSPDVAAEHATLLASKGEYRRALAHLDHYESLRARQPPPHGWSMRRAHAWVLERQGYWAFEIGRLRHNLETEIAQQAPQ